MCRSLIWNWFLCRVAGWNLFFSHLNCHLSSNYSLIHSFPLVAYSQFPLSMCAYISWLSILYVLFVPCTIALSFLFTVSFIISLDVWGKDSSPPSELSYLFLILYCSVWILGSAVHSLRNMQQSKNCLTILFQFTVNIQINLERIGINGLVLLSMHMMYLST